MLRLTVRHQSPEETVLQVDGWVANEEAEVLAAEGRRLLRVSRRLVLELAGVAFIDAAGLALLEELAGPRLVLRDGSPFIQHLLERHGLRCEEGGEAGR